MIQLPPLEANSGIPLYRQLYAGLRDAIQTGLLRQGDRIPPTRELAQLTGVNRATVAAAYDLLETEGLIRGHVGRGSFVLGNGAPRTREADLISFATSRPAEQLFPMHSFRATVNEVLNDPRLSSILQLGAPAGYAPLRRWLRESSGLATPGDEVLVTSGCQQALDLIQRALLAPGDTVLVEDPVYPGLKNVFERGRLRLVPMPVDAGHVDPAQVERAIATERPKLIVVTPDFQNPTGASMPVETRRRIALAAGQARVPIVEIDLYRDLRYEGDPLPTLKELAPGTDVLLLRSFSKIAFPGLRVGWVLGPQPLLARLTEAKQWADLHSDQLSQAILLRFAESGRLQQHLQQMIAAGRECLLAAMAGCERELPPGTRFTRPQGGMNLWVTLPAPLDATELLQAAEREGLTYLPGKHFQIEAPAGGQLRLSFAGLPAASISTGLAALGRAVRAELERLRLTAPSPDTAMV
ncbi:MAG: PLP-dependent aminotransferase family protein [Bryobacteraceae bacterium]|nr:PLP-dependent aminotransferase family protein [Bryobacteraceae bacterium]